MVFFIPLSYSLWGCLTIGGEIYNPDLEGENMTVLLFLVHRLCGNFGMLKESLLIPFLENIVLILIVLFKIEVG
jgi:hypothetical protein